MKVLLADDEASITLTLAHDLEDAGHQVTVVADGEAAVSALTRERYDCLITDIAMPGMTGDQVLEAAKARHPEIGVIVITGFGTIESAVAVMKAGADDYVLKPFVNEQILLQVDRLSRSRALEKENEALKEQIAEERGFASVIGQSEAMQKVFRTVRTVAKSDANVLIVGETGTGKERIAKALHEHSLRKKGPFVAISCAAIPSGLLEDELFGHEKGAFTDARDKKLGRIERANQGSFFLDDIDDMPLATQVKLLRVLQERELERLGGAESIKVDMRVITATKVDLRELVREGKFREDLFYRLNVVPIPLPPLRQRDGDIPLLARWFIQKYGQGREYEIKPEVLAAMEAYVWPGNVRELEHAIERAIALSGNSKWLQREHLVERSPLHKMALDVPTRIKLLKEIVEEAERVHIREVLAITANHRAQAATLLGISRKNLWEKMRLYDIDPETDKERR